MSDNIPTFGAITSEGSFKLWGSDNFGSLGNGDGGYNNVDMDNPMGAFNSDVATPTTPNSDGTTPSPNPEVLPNYSSPIPSFPPA